MADLIMEQRAMRKHFARLISRDCIGTEEEILDAMERLQVFGDWSFWEITHRPVDLAELVEIVEEELLETM